MFTTLVCWVNFLHSLREAGFPPSRPAISTLGYFSGLLQSLWVIQSVVKKGHSFSASAHGVIVKQQEHDLLLAQQWYLVIWIQQSSRERTWFIKET